MASGRKAHRTIDGEYMDIRTLAKKWGWSEHAIRKQAERRRIPFCRLGRRIMFDRTKIAEFEKRMDDVSLKEALENIRNRNGPKASV